MTRRFTREAWLELGLKRLADLGPSSLTVDQLCAAAEKTRGSFYHHFQDHAAFLADLVTLWRRRHTEDVIAAVDQAPTSARGAELSSLARALNRRLELEIRRLAQSDAAVARIVAETDAVRVAFVADLRRADASSEDPIELAKLEYAAFIGSMVIWPDASDAEFRQLDALFQRLALGGSARG